MTWAKRITFSCVSVLALLVLLASLFSPVLPVQAHEGGSMVVSPKGMITDTTPTIKWYRISIATKYEYEVYKGSTLWQKVTDIGLSHCGLPIAPTPPARCIPWDPTSGVCITMMGLPGQPGRSTWASR